MIEGAGGILPGIDGHDALPAALRPTAKLPERLLGVLVGRDGRPKGLDLPSLDDRGAAEAWRLALGPGPYFVRFEDRANEPPLSQVQRVSRLGEVWLDCAIDGIDGALELLIAGASRLVVWGDDPELLDGVSDSAVVGWDGRQPLEVAVKDAEPHEVPIVAAVPVPHRDDLDAGLYQLPPQPWTGIVQVQHIGAPVPDHGEDE